jgi:hypothetical protein
MAAVSIQFILAAMNPAPLTPSSLSTAAALEGYGIALGSRLVCRDCDAIGLVADHLSICSSLTAAELEFANCVWSASNDPMLVFSVQSFVTALQPNVTVSNSSLSRRSLLAIGGASSGSIGRTSAKASSAFSNLNGYTILTGLDNVEVRYNIHDLGNPNPTRRIGASLSNVILGGLFIHTARKPPSADWCPHSLRFSDLVITSSCQQRAGSSPAGGSSNAIGNDPVFSPSSVLYKPLLDPSDWYNMSLGSPEFNPATNLPYGFFASSLPGRSLGYPVLVSSYVSGTRARQELAYLLEGGLLDPLSTDTMTLDLLVYNPLAFVFGKFTASFTWSASGLIYMKFSFSGLPATSYSAQTSLWRVDQMVPDLVLLVLILTYVLLTTISLVSEWRIEAERHKLGHDKGDHFLADKEEKKEARLQEGM